jgi:hypothetical protein
MSAAIEWLYPAQPTNLYEFLVKKEPEKPAILITKHPLLQVKLFCFGVHQTLQKIGLGGLGWVCLSVERNVDLHFSLPKRSRGSTTTE